MQAPCFMYRRMNVLVRQRIAGSDPKAGLQHRSQQLPVGRRRLSLVTAASVVAQPAVLELKSVSGETTGSKQLALTVADPLTATGLVHRTLVTVRQNSRRGTASTLTRSEVRGGGKKPYAQKGTGNARIGSRRTPLRPGGGVSFGPKPTDWTIRMNKKERRLAVATALQSAACGMIIVDDIKEAVQEPKTRSLTAALDTWGLSPTSHVLLIVDEITDALRLSSRNVPTIRLNASGSLSIYDILRADSIVIEGAALTYIQDYYGNGKESNAAC